MYIIRWLYLTLFAAFVITHVFCTLLILHWNYVPSYVFFIIYVSIYWFCTNSVFFLRFCHVYCAKELSLPCEYHILPYGYSYVNLETNITWAHALYYDSIKKNAHPLEGWGCDNPVSIVAWKRYSAIFYDVHNRWDLCVKKVGRKRWFM